VPVAKKPPIAAPVEKPKKAASSAKRKESPAAAPSDEDDGEGTAVVKEKKKKRKLGGGLLKTGKRFNWDVVEVRHPLPSVVARSPLTLCSLVALMTRARVSRQCSRPSSRRPSRPSAAASRASRSPAGGEAPDLAPAFISFFFKPSSSSSFRLSLPTVSDSVMLFD
jgi:hypothetical protein